MTSSTSKPSRAEGVKLTAAQLRFLTQTAEGHRFTKSVLSGSEVAMAERLFGLGLVWLERYERCHDWFYAITPAGRQALEASR